MSDEQLDVIVVGAHPDDVEIACGGTLAKLAQQGYRVGIVDLTDGEPTPGSAGPEVRLAEAQQAAAVLGLSVRVTLDLPNRRLFDTFEARVALACQFRKYRPRLVLGMAGKTPMASPDHYQAGLITEAGVFYSRLTKWDEHFDGLTPHTIPAMLYYHLGFRTFWPADMASVVFDVGDVLQKKLDAIACYRSQFPPEKAGLFDRVRAMAEHHGTSAGFTAGELLSSPTPLRTQDLMGMLFGLA